MNPLLVAVKRAFKQPAFVVAVVLIGLCAATLNTTAAFLKVRFKKQPCALRAKSLKEGVPQALGHWVLVSKDQAIDPELEQVLGTSEYVFRDYVDSRKVTPAEIAAMKAASSKDRDVLLAKLQGAHPSSVIRAAVTYYTGLVDTVAHVPERCYVADGFEVKEYEERAVSLGNYTDGTPRDLKYRFLGFEDQTGMGLHVEARGAKRGVCVSLRRPV